jgi:ADP-heptose:LPS heptosyltransferase
LKAPGRVLVIKLSALGDVVLAFPAFTRIRAAHPDAHITLLTTPPYSELAATGPWFDAVDPEGRPRTLLGLLALIRRIRLERFDRVYDLQANDRTNLLFQTLRPFPPAWSGTAFGCALPDTGRRMTRHILERQAHQLQTAGIWPGAPTAAGMALPPDLTWMRRKPSRVPSAALAESRPIALLVPGAAPTRPAKLWPAEAYADLADRMLKHGLAVMVLGGPAEAAIAGSIASAAPGVVDLTGGTDFAGVGGRGHRGCR